MPVFDTNRIFNGSPEKVLAREFNNLKTDYSKMNALKYKMLYENADLSFILENSRLIFAEPMYGCNFYKNIIENVTLPFTALEYEREKLDSYIQENVSKMAPEQKEMYESLLNMIDNKFFEKKNSINLYSAMVESDNTSELYNALYEYNKDSEHVDASEMFEFFESEDVDIMNAMNAAIGIPEAHSGLYKYLTSCYVENCKTEDDYKLNAYSHNVLSRMMKDKYFSEKVNHLGNVNLRHLILGIAGVKDTELMESAITEVEKEFVSNYSSSNNSVNQMFNDIFNAEYYESVNNEEKLNNLKIEKAIVDVNLGFAILDSYVKESSDMDNSIIEQLCVESTEIEAIPQEIDKQIEMLEAFSNKLSGEINDSILVCEKYFTNNGSANAIISKDIGFAANDDPSDKDNAKKDKKVYTPKRHIETSDEEDDDDEDDVYDDENEPEADNALDDTEEKKKTISREEAKKRRDDKYSKMEINDKDFDFNSVSSEVLNDMNHMFESENKSSDSEEKSSDDDGEDDPSDVTLDNTAANNKPEKKGLFAKKPKYAKVDKPEKRPFFQRIQNKALDANVKFKKTVAQGRRTTQDIRNAGKAISKIPMNIVNAVKGTIDRWDEMDDNRRKEYILQPGFRKKYFKALKLALAHYVAFAVNPLLNVVLFMSQHLSAKKDIRIRNEFLRELNAEVKVIDEKIQDAKENGDRKAKYQLMRYKEKIEAEITRIGANSKYI